MAHGANRAWRDQRTGLPAAGRGGLAVVVSARPGRPMNAFLVSLATVAFAEIGDRTQLLSLCLAAHYRRPWPILAGILTATLVNHALAGVAGAVLARFLTPLLLDTLVGASMVAMALWTLRPDAPGGKDVPAGGHGIFFATLTLAAAYPNLIAVVAGAPRGLV